MSELPRRLSPRTSLSANWLNRLLDFLRSRDLRAGPGIKLTRTPSGTTVSTVPDPAVARPAEAVPARIVAFDDGVYTADLAGGGRVQLVLTEVQMKARLQSGTWVLAHPVTADAAPVRDR